VITLVSKRLRQAFLSFAPQSGEGKRACRNSDSIRANFVLKALAMLNNIANALLGLTSKQPIGE
jgi:hypothetical protein